MLRLTPERVREMLEAGEIEGIPTAGGERWMIPIHGDRSPNVPPPPVTPIPAEPPTGHSEARDAPSEALEDSEAPRQPADPPSGDAAASSREATSESGWVSTQQAARALGISARTVRWHIERGNLEAKPEGEGVQRAWLVSIDSLNAFRDTRQPTGEQPRGYRAPHEAADNAAETPGNAVRELADRLVEEARRAEAARVRLELSERAQSSLEAELSEERRRREEAERQRDDLRRELEAERESREDAPESAEPRSDRGGPPDAGGGAQEGSERPWWRRWLGS